MKSSPDMSCYHINVRYMLLLSLKSFFFLLEGVTRNLTMDTCSEMAGKRKWEEKKELFSPFS